jgi:hypothetical protein|nr:MAG TPA: Baseplate wedge protein [Caudoviricetes sp.]
MPPAVRGSGADVASGHGSFPPTNTDGCSGNVTINSIGAHRLGDSIIPHGSPSPSPVHSRAAGGCSPNVTVNGLGLVRLGDAVKCGGVLITGSGNVICN